MCVECGTRVNDAYGNKFFQNTNNIKSDEKSAGDLVNTLSVRYNTYGIIWIVIEIIQIISVACIPVGVWNLYAAYTNIKYGKSIRRNPTNIVASHIPLTGIIIVLVINLLFGGVVGVAGSIYYLFAIRAFVMENKDAFLSIEASQK